MQSSMYLSTHPSLQPSTHASSHPSTYFPCIFHSYSMYPSAYPLHSLLCSFCISLCTLSMHPLHTLHALSVYPSTYSMHPQHTFPCAFQCILLNTPSVDSSMHFSVTLWTLSTYHPAHPSVNSMYPPEYLSVQLLCTLLAPLHILSSIPLSVPSVHSQCTLSVPT